MRPLLRYALAALVGQAVGASASVAALEYSCRSDRREMVAHRRTKPAHHACQSVLDGGRDRLAGKATCYSPTTGCAVRPEQACLDSVSADCWRRAYDCEPYEEPWDGAWVDDFYYVPVVASPCGCSW